MCSPANRKQRFVLNQRQAEAPLGTVERLFRDVFVWWLWSLTWLEQIGLVYISYTWMFSADKLMTSDIL